MKKLLLIILVPVLLIGLFYVYGTQSSISPEYYDTVKVNDNAQPSLSDTLKIMTYNIGWLSGMTNNLPVERDVELYNQNLNACVESLNKEKPNILALQEIDLDSDRSFNINQPDSLQKYCAYKYGALALNWDKKFVPFPGYNPKYFFGKTISAQYILSELEVVENTFDKLIKPINAPFYYNAFYLERLIQKTTLKTNRGEMMVLNVHLEAFDEETRSNHIQKSIEVFEKYRKIMPTLLVGDFNSPQDTLGTRNNLLDELIKMKDVGMAIPDSVYKADMVKHNTYSTGNPYTKIDFIFYSSDKIKAVESGVMQEIGEVSDHFPVWMKFVIRE
ncbi:MAG: endonuclease/exonuclease/phosphatase family protein [Bacteroidota bacterium]